MWILSIWHCRHLPGSLERLPHSTPRSCRPQLFCISPACGSTPFLARQLCASETWFQPKMFSDQSPFKTWTPCRIAGGTARRRPSSIPMLAANLEDKHRLFSRNCGMTFIDISRRRSRVHFKNNHAALYDCGRSTINCIFFVSILISFLSLSLGSSLVPYFVSFSGSSFIFLPNHHFKVGFDRILQSLLSYPRSPTRHQRRRTLYTGKKWRIRVCVCLFLGYDWPLATEMTERRMMRQAIHATNYHHLALRHCTRA